MEKWYELDESERIKKIYSKFTIQDFWDFWSNKEDKVMEVRIKDYKLIKVVADKFNLKYSSSGVYVSDGNTLKNVIGFTRNKATVWFGYSPRKMNWMVNGNKGYGSGARGGSSEHNINELQFIFIDIDRITKQKQATKAELKRCNTLADILLGQLHLEGWNKSYIKIASGNGVQLLIKLDFGLAMPETDFDNEYKIFKKDESFEKTRKLLSVVGRQIISFCNKNKFNDKLDVEVDRSCFRISQVCALPFTKNYKFDSYTWRGIVELKDGKNEGLADWLLSKEDDIQEFKDKNVFRRATTVSPENMLRPDKVMENSLVRFMLHTNLPFGMVNNYLWFQLKCLVRDAGLDFSYKKCNNQIRNLHKLLEKKFKGSLSTNLPDKKFNFDEAIVNAYCRKNLILPIYKVRSYATKQICSLEKFEWASKDTTLLGEMKLDYDLDIIGDMNSARTLFIGGDIYYNAELIGSFTNACIKKYGEKKTRYYFDYWFYRYLNFR